MEHQLRLTIDGREQTVMLNEMVHPIHCMFHAVFEDGYENIFLWMWNMGNGWNRIWDLLYWLT